MEILRCILLFWIYYVFGLGEISHGSLLRVADEAAQIATYMLRHSYGLDGTALYKEEGCWHTIFCELKWALHIDNIKHVLEFCIGNAWLAKLSNRNWATLAEIRFTHLLLSYCCFAIDRYPLNRSYKRQQRFFITEVFWWKAQICVMRGEARRVNCCHVPCIGYSLCWLPWRWCEKSTACPTIASE